MENVHKKSHTEHTPLFSLPNGEKWRIFLTWGLLALLGFPVVYGTTNYLATLTHQRYNFYFQWETQTPFIPEFMYFYLSLNLIVFLPLFMCNAKKLKQYCQSNVATLVLAGLFFWIFPTQLGFAREIPEDPQFLKELFVAFFNIDKPHNLVPSLHVTFAALGLYAVYDSHKEKTWIKWMALIWFSGIFLSIVFVRQHHFTDGFAGLLLAILGVYWFFKPQQSI